MARLELLLMGMGIALSLAVGCAPADYGAICEEAIGCVAGNSNDIDACVRNAELNEEQADILGCTEEFTDFAQCIEERGQCIDRNNDGQPEWSTMDGNNVADLCQLEEDNFGACLGGDAGNFAPLFQFVD